MGFQFLGAATRKDWLEAFGSVKNGPDLRYFRADFYTDPQIASVSLEEIENLDMSISGIAIQEPFYYVLQPQQSLVVREISMNDGSRKYAIDRYKNASTFIFRPGGTYIDKCFIISELSSVWDKGESVDVAKQVITYIRRHWNRDKGYWIGPDCFNQYNATYRFTDDCR